MLVSLLLSELPVIPRMGALEIRNRSVKVFKKGVIHNQIHQYLGTLPTLGLVTFSIKYIRRSYNTALNDHSQNRVNAFSCHPSFHQSKVSGRIYLSCTNVAKLQIRDTLSLRLFSDAKLHILTFKQFRIQFESLSS